MDEKTVNYSEKRFEEIKTEMTTYLKGIGYNVEKKVKFCPISGF